jgi:membrane associated rhomboid family serine protease
MSFRYYGRPTMSFGGAGLTDWVKVLLIINVAVFIAQMVAWSPLVRYFGLIPADVFAKLRIWQFVTYMFLHGDFFHILLNMLVLWMFGSAMERTWGSETFIRYYFFTGVGAGVLTWVLSPGSPVPNIGASGAIYGILLAFAMTYPDRIIYYIFIPIPAKYLVLLLGIFEFMASVRHTSDGIGHFAHLGGMLFGLIYLRWFGVASWARPKGKGWWDPAFWRESVRRWRRRQRMKVIDFQQKRDAARKAEVDAILEKIAREGMDSLTAREKKMLEEESNRDGGDA